MDTPLPYQPDDLLVKFLLGEANANEVTEASNWIAANPENEKYFHQLRAVWENHITASPVSESDENAAWLRFQKRIQSENTHPLIINEKKRRILPFSKSLFLRVAASILIAVPTLAIAYFIYNELSGPAIRQIATSSTIKQQQLPDGSTITLNKNSTLSYPEHFAQYNREVSLHGEGFFNIQPNKNKPFLVHVNKLTVRVVGTSFNIRETNGKTEVIVETGIVQVIQNDKTVELYPGERIVASETGGRFEKEQQADQLYNYYRTKTFTCDNTPLWKLVEVLNQAYETQITISNPAIRNLPLTTTFEEEPLDNILRIIAQTLDIRVEKSDGKIALK